MSEMERGAGRRHREAGVWRRHWSSWFVSHPHRSGPLFALSRPYLFSFQMLEEHKAIFRVQAEWKNYTLEFQHYDHKVRRGAGKKGAGHRARPQGGQPHSLGVPYPFIERSRSGSNLPSSLSCACLAPGERAREEVQRRQFQGGHPSQCEARGQPGAAEAAPFPAFLWLLAPFCSVRSPASALTHPSPLFPVALRAGEAVQRQVDDGGGRSGPQGQAGQGKLGSSDETSERRCQECANEGSRARLDLNRPVSNRTPALWSPLFLPFLFLWPLAPSLTPRSSAGPPPSWPSPSGASSPV